MVFEIKTLEEVTAVTSDRPGSIRLYVYNV